MGRLEDEDGFGHEKEAGGVEELFSRAEISEVEKVRGCIRKEANESRREEAYGMRGEEG